MRSARLLLMICVAACISQGALSAIQTRTGKKPAVPQSRTASGRNGPSDAEIERAIRARFAASKISADKFQVHVQGGVATLEGRTDVIQHKGTATRLARACGALQVTNRIEVSKAARERASANLAKGRRRAQIKRGEPRSQAAGR